MICLAEPKPRLLAQTRENLENNVPSWHKRRQSVILALWQLEYGRSEFDRQMPGAGLSYTITSRELVLQAPHPTASTAGPLRALPLTPRWKGMIL